MPERTTVASDTLDALLRDIPKRQKGQFDGDININIGTVCIIYAYNPATAPPPPTGKD